MVQTGSITVEERDEDAAYDDARQREVDEGRDARDAVQAYDDAVKRASALTVCPKCSADTAIARHGPDCSAGCDTSVRYCLECEWQGQPE